MKLQIVHICICVMGLIMNNVEDILSIPHLGAIFVLCHMYASTSSNTCVRKFILHRNNFHNVPDILYLVATFVLFVSFGTMVYVTMNCTHHYH